ncbi:hypothetical protein SAMN05216553_104303 [Lentzea fradiae]|uniref:Uncharacterized protein n=1 Tax=Lentzea fradiae TaxID=200378 RepID=A0A1G7Q7E3_9PSEU|nr:hypothetical protein SAMN05216553_104303 [Lentzea fradiae]
MVWWLLESRQWSPRAERQRHGDQRALVRQEDPQCALVQPHHGFRRPGPGQHGRDREHQADLRERQRERRVVGRVEVRHRFSRDADRRHRVAAERRQHRVPGRTGQQQRRTGHLPARQRVAELPDRPPHRVRQHRHQQDRDEHTPRVLVQPAHQRCQREQHQVHAEEPQRRHDEEPDGGRRSLVDTAQDQSEKDDRPCPEHQRRRHYQLLQPDEERSRRVRRGEPTGEEEQPERLQHPRNRCQCGEMPQRAVDVHASGRVDQRRHEPMSEHDGDDGDGPHCVDERVPHGFSPEAMRTSAASVAVPGS